MGREKSPPRPDEPTPGLDILGLEIGADSRVGRTRRAVRLQTVSMGWTATAGNGMNARQPGVRSEEEAVSTMRENQELREELIATMRAMNALGINQGKSGNGSVRHGEGFLITPAAIAYDELSADDIVAMDFGGAWQAKSGIRPSSEWRFHRDILQGRPEMNAVLHTHGRAVATLACMQRAIPAFHYMVAIAGGKDIRCADYATFGTQELSDHVQLALRGRKACLLAHHGLITVGASLKEAFAIAVEVEHLSDVYWRTLQLGEPGILDDAEMETVLEKFRGGYRSSRD